MLHKIFKDLAVLSCKPLIIATILMIHVCWVHLISFVLIAERFIDGFKFSCSDFEYSIHWRWASYFSSGEIAVKNNMKMKRKHIHAWRKWWNFSFLDAMAGYLGWNWWWWLLRDGCCYIWWNCNSYTKVGKSYNSVEYYLQKIWYCWMSFWFAK